MDVNSHLWINLVDHKSIGPVVLTPACTVAYRTVYYGTFDTVSSTVSFTPVHGMSTIILQLALYSNTVQWYCNSSEIPGICYCSHSSVQVYLPVHSLKVRKVPCTSPSTLYMHICVANSLKLAIAYYIFYVQYPNPVLFFHQHTMYLVLPGTVQYGVCCLLILRV